MTPDQIQLFLNSKVPSCDTNGSQIYSGSTTRAQYGASGGYPAPYTCLKDYYQTTVTKAPEAGRCNGHTAGYKSAAQIIHEVAQSCGINPQVLLVLLQKEQSLITDTWPWSIQYRSATGYGCPDTAPCDEEYYGFFNQVYEAARAFKRYAANPVNYNYRAGRNNYIQYNPNASCGGSNVYIQNQATANLYIYTPYQPNASALNNLYGSGDGCGAYGNRNFWRMFNDWFGSTYSNDTFQTHPSGTLINDGGSVYLVQDNIKRYVSYNAFRANGFTWASVRPATTGDKILHVDNPLPSYVLGTLFTTPGSPVFVVDHEGGNIVKRHVSYSAFTVLGFDWNKVITLNAAEVPQTTAPTLLLGDKHPSGSLITLTGDPRVYLIENNTRRHVVNGFAFESYGYRWTDIKSGTATDAQVPIGAPLEARRGSVTLSDGSIYVVDYDINGSMKRPIGPWECFADQLYYRLEHLYITPTYNLPIRTGSVFTC